MMTPMRFVFVLWGMLTILIVPMAEGRDQEREDVLKPEDFAYGFPVEGNGTAPFQEMVLPLEFYQGVTRPDLEDCAVFDSDHRPAPHAIRSPGQPSPARMTEWLPLFPVSARPENGSGAVSLHFKRAPDGTILDLRSGADVQPGDRTTAYVMDASFLNDPYSALELKFEPERESRMIQVSLEGSSDLNQWTSIARSQTVGHLVHQGHSLEKSRVEFSPCRYKYLRLTWEPQGGDLRLLEARVAFSKQITEDLHQWLQLRAELKREPQPGYYVDTRGVMPVDRLKVVFPGTNVAVPVRVYSRKSAQDVWQFRSEALVHRLIIEEKVVSGEEIKLLNTVTDRLWKLEARLRPEEGGAPGEVELAVGWVPHRLIFLTQDKPLYTLAFGSGSRKSAPFPVQTLMEKVAPRARSGVLVASADLGPKLMLGGEEKLRPPQPPLPWKQWILWGVLVTGVALMGWMAVTLHRRLGPAQSAIHEESAPAAEQADKHTQNGDPG